MCDDWRNHSFDNLDLSGKVMSLLFNKLSRLVIAFPSRSKNPLISWLQWFWTQENKVCHYFHFFPIYNAKECSHYLTIALISHTSKAMVKILQARLQQYLNHEFPNVQARFRKAEEPNTKLPTSVGSSEKQESSRKTSISALLTMPKLLTVCITKNCGKFWKRWEYQTTWPACWEIWCMSRSNS